MHYELWGLHPANLIATAAREAEALDIVRALLDAGWSVEELSLGLEPDPGDPQDRSTLPVWEGAELKARLHVAA